MSLNCCREFELMGDAQAAHWLIRQRSPHVAYALAYYEYLRRHVPEAPDHAPFGIDEVVALRIAADCTVDFQRDVHQRLKSEPLGLGRRSND